jgi:hypothetical protein
MQDVIAELKADTTRFRKERDELKENDTNLRLLVESLEKLNQAYHDGREKAKADSKLLREELSSFERDVMSGKGSLCEMSDDACLDIVHAIKSITSQQVLNDIDTGDKEG